MRLFTVTLMVSGLFISCQSIKVSPQTPDILPDARQFAPENQYDLSQLNVSGTRFYVFTRKEPVLRDVDFEAPIKAYWPYL